MWEGKVRGGGVGGGGGGGGGGGVGGGGGGGGLGRAHQVCLETPVSMETPAESSCSLLA